MFHWPSIFTYTDTFDLYRVVETEEGGITKHERVKLLESIPCRAYQNSTPGLQVSEQAAMSNADNQLCCDVDVDIRAGDEIIVHRMARVKSVSLSDRRYFAGRPTDFTMPFGGVWCDIEHKQVALLNEWRAD